jgi:amino acid transporter
VKELRHGYVSLLENFAQTLGVLSPAGTLSVIIPLLILSAGNGTWLLLVITLCIFLLVMLSVLRFAALHCSAGSLAAFTRLGLGPRGGLIGGWIYVLGMAYCVPSAALTSASYVDLLLVPWIGPPASPLRLCVITTLVMLACWFAAFRGVRLSTHLMLVIESFSVGLMTLLIVAGMAHAHAWIDRPQLALSGVHFAGVQGGLVLAFMLMAGFEGATSLGEESKDPKQAIPRAISSCMLPLTLLYLFMTYCIVALMNRGIIARETEGLTVPFQDVAQALGVASLGRLSSLGVALSYFACALGSLTVAARVLYSMSRDGLFFAGFAEIHPRTATPHRAIALLAVISLAIPVCMLLNGVTPAISINFVSQLGSIGLIGGYLLVVVALPLYLKRQGLLNRRDVAVAAVATAMLVLVVVLSVYPVPPAPYVYVVYVFIGSALLGLLVSAALSIQRARAALGTSAT